MRSWERCERLGPERAFTRWQWLGMAALLVCCALAKPVFLQAFVPAAALYFLLKWIRYPQRTRYFVTLLAAVLPSVLVMVLQLAFYFFHPSDTTGMTLSLTMDKLLSSLISLVLMEAFPLFVLLTDREARRGGMLLELTVWTNTTGFLERMLLSETGRRAADGNFAWGLMVSASLMWTVMLLGRLFCAALFVVPLRDLFRAKPAELPYRLFRFEGNLGIFRSDHQQFHGI